MKKILVRAPQWLGDAVVSTVFLTRLRNRYPSDDISVLCPAALAPLFETHPSVASVLTLPYPQETVFAAAKKIAAEKFDEVYILPRSFRSALESYFAKIPSRIGYAGDLRRLLLTQAFPYDEHLRYAHRYLKLIGEENFPLDQVQPYFPSIPLRTSAPTSNLSGAWEKIIKPILGIAPISIAPSRTWSGERFAEVANRFLKERGGTVIFFGSKNEQPQIQKICDEIHGSVINTAGQLSLPELGEMIRQCDLFLCNDSGLMHVAACFKIPTVVLFGASDPATALPPWGKFTALQHKEIFCVPCLKNECVRFGSDRLACLRAIKTDDVYKVVKNPSHFVS